ncbi:MAG: alpha-ketoacid dehydrogenase subunit beta [Candidatus Omnitrophica bacterium]|nr:alpha-ketoacid dehydrogenase subunit beta [Candidatus Omnitrophota bacterium]
MMREISYSEAIREALKEEMLKDESVFLLGEDIGFYGGAFGVTRGLIDEFGPERVKNTPISENSFVGVAVGAAMVGMRPIVEIMFMDFITLAMDQIVNHAAKLHYLYDGQVRIPLVVRTPAGAGRGYGASHSQSLEAWFMHVPGLKIVSPSTPYDAKGLLKTAIRDNNPVIFIENKLLYAAKGDVPKKEYTIPLGKADIKKRGKDLTIIAYSRMVHLALEAAEELKGGGVEAEVIDLRSLVPIDMDTVINSVKKTGRVIVVEEDNLTGGVGAEISSLVNEHVFKKLKAPVRRVASADVPIPCAPALEQAILPSKDKLIKIAKEIMMFKR